MQTVGNEQQDFRGEERQIISSLWQAFTSLNKANQTCAKMALDSGDLIDLRRVLERFQNKIDHNN